MTPDITAAEQFVLTHARLLDRHRLAVLLHDAPIDPVLDALRPYRNPDGGFGHALEPDVRGPGSEPAAVLHGLEVLREIGAGDDPLVAGAVDWVASIADDDGGVPVVTPDAADYPHAPWMTPAAGGSAFTLALTALLTELGHHAGWTATGTRWCWARLESGEALDAYTTKFALAFLDAVPDEERARTALSRLSPALGADGSLVVHGEERLRLLELSPEPGLRSRALFSDAQVDAALAELAADQRPDGGWMFDWAAWCDGQAIEWRGAVTVLALRRLAAHGRL